VEVSTQYTAKLQWWQRISQRLVSKYLGG